MRGSGNSDLSFGFWPQRKGSSCLWYCCFSVNFNLSSNSVAGLAPRKEDLIISQLSPQRNIRHSFLLFLNTIATGHRASSHPSSFIFLSSPVQLGCAVVVSPWFESTISLPDRQFPFTMSPDLPMNRQKARPSIQPVLPELSRLFKAHNSKKKAEPSSSQASPSDIDQGAVRTKEIQESAIQASPRGLSSEAVVGQEDFNNTNSVEEKAVSASTGERYSHIIHERRLTHNNSLPNCHPVYFDSSHPRTRCRSLKLPSR